MPSDDPPSAEADAGQESLLQHRVDREAADVQATRDALKSRKFPVEYVEMSGQTHNYVRSAKEINGKAWEFLLKNPLPADPRYTAYSDPAQ